MTDYHIKNWNQYQQYKDRNPPWIKLHHDILTSNDWIMLNDEGRLTMVVCMLIASRNRGNVPNDPDLVKRTGRLEFVPDLEQLQKCGFFIELTQEIMDASSSYQVHPPSVSSYLNLNLLQSKKEVVKDAKEVLEYLVLVTGRSFSKYDNIARCLVREKCSVEDCKKVIDFKAAQWKGKDQLEHLNGRTPWRPMHFSDYLDEASAQRASNPVGYVKPPKTDDWGNVIPRWKLEMQEESK